ncbi:MAG: hypothetical protein RBT63_03695 [Bdellovibrionales bacterium]|jgi:hypothetical protein|nr:hypothetical protein [Bdellovibrionales bacterium]
MSAPNNKSHLPANLPAMREIPPTAPFKKGDVLVVFGELFARGYANGIVDEAERAGLTVIRSTVGRRDTSGENAGKLRALNAEELALQKTPFINIPLEAGFDLEPAFEGGPTPVSFFEGVKLGEWEKAPADFSMIEKSRERGRARFRNSVRAYVNELKKVLPKDRNIIFCHTMAGGVPRTKIIMPVMNRVFKGTGDRHVPSSALFESALGRFSLMNFEDVTAETFRVLVEETAELANEITSAGGSSRYIAYGYHGTEVMVGNHFEWQTYTPYFQGWAKMSLERIATEFHAKGIQACVYNCPEILTNSSSIFLGVELSLYPLLGALREVAKTAPSNEGKARVEGILKECLGLLKEDVTIDGIMAYTREYIESELIRTHSVFEKWPQNNSAPQMEKMLAASSHLFSHHKDEKQLITAVLSEQVFRSTGHVMFHDSFTCPKPVQWLGHDVLSAALASGKTL